MWRYTCDIKTPMYPPANVADDWIYDDENFAKIRDGVVAALKTAQDYVPYEEPSQTTHQMDFYELVEELSRTPDVPEFNEVLTSIYDWADENRVWLGVLC